MLHSKSNNVEWKHLLEKLLDIYTYKRIVFLRVKKNIRIIMTSLTVHYNYVLFGFFPFSCFYWDIWVFICWYSTRTILNYKLEYCIGLLQRLLFKYLLSKTKVIFRIHKKSFSRKKHVIFFKGVCKQKTLFYLDVTLAYLDQIDLPSHTVRIFSLLFL